MYKLFFSSESIIRKNWLHSFSARVGDASYNLVDIHSAVSRVHFQPYWYHTNVTALGFSTELNTKGVSFLWRQVWQHLPLLFSDPPFAN